MTLRLDARWLYPVLGTFVGAALGALLGRALRGDFVGSNAVFELHGVAAGSIWGLFAGLGAFVWRRLGARGLLWFAPLPVIQVASTVLH